ncbi:hypothetical protein GCM10010954_16140 [Halobacillus andaensis]|uniref:DUF4440 domain-containing protein n=1 Tax=Halobacillus andaensis TaxID=1176239 RepID=A0A917B234_HALAA|nr:SgcJ/EcaC family oxidoreductase [Halobacillus andaensis]MBP2004884.1 uncharacterized protein (TIGR02246 family) [Halobacillus andaensis]GGF18123.1 hypothetical protein GCM10010954_16140 [Halobacillus andaensis]
MNGNKESRITKTYEQLIDAWNSRNAEAMALLFTESGESIGFDGSMSKGPLEINEHLAPIFENHPTAPYVYKIKEVRMIGEEAAIVRAIAGMIPPGESDLKPEVNTHHTLVVVLKGEQWKIDLFQNTPAQFHGRPELVEQMTEELRRQL